MIGARHKALALGLSVALASCTTLSENACQEGDWAAIGLRDGTLGRAASFVDNHAKACADLGIVPDRSAWEAGRQRGLQSYCSPDNAYRLGRNGRRLSHVCTPTQMAALDAPNRHGLRYYEIGRDIADLERERRSIDADLANLTRRAGPRRAALLSDRSRVMLRITMLLARQQLYASWP